MLEFAPTLRMLPASPEVVPTQMQNPLTASSDLPAFSQIRAAHVRPAIDAILRDNRSRLDELPKQVVTGDYAGTVLALEALEDRLQRAWSPVRHLHSVCDDDALREAYNGALAKIADYNSELGQNEALYRLFESIANDKSFATLAAPDQQLVRLALRDFQLGGVGLDAEPRARCRAIHQELAGTQAQFEENVLDATQAWTKHIDDPARLAGLPESVKELAAQSAADAHRDGWMLTLHMPSYLPVMRYAEDRELRFEHYEAYVTRASDRGPTARQWDNSGVMQAILKLRQELAKLLGFDSYAHYSVATKMARDPEEVLNFLRQLAAKAKPQALSELDELATFAREKFGITELHAWDMAFFSEKLREEKYSVSEEELRPYFPAAHVVEGLFAVVSKLYGLQITEQPNDELWNEDVRFYRLNDANGETRGQFYLDLYSRLHKRGGAWMDECVSRRVTAEGVQLPVAYLTCNFTPPIGGAPSLLTHNEVVTLFHEFGHGLHLLLTRIDRTAVSGLNGVAWDAVELPSQFMENWCWEYDAIRLISGHVDTGEPLSVALFERIVAARNFQSALQLLRQLEFALFDFRIHMDHDTEAENFIQATLDEVRRQVAVVSYPEFNRFQHGFSHIFAGGYAAGYYSYKWAEVLAADAFAKFEAEGIFNTKTGGEFLRAILERGGSQDALDLFVEFRGREPEVDALLRQTGIVG